MQLWTLLSSLHKVVIPASSVGPEVPRAGRWEGKTDLEWREKDKPGPTKTGGDPGRETGARHLPCFLSVTQVTCRIGWWPAEPHTQLAGIWRSRRLARQEQGGGDSAVPLTEEGSQAPREPARCQLTAQRVRRALYTDYPPRENNFKSDKT